MLGKGNQDIGTESRFEGCTLSYIIFRTWVPQCLGTLGGGREERV